MNSAHALESCAPLYLRYCFIVVKCSMDFEVIYCLFFLLLESIYSSITYSKTASSNSNPITRFHRATTRQRQEDRIKTTTTSKADLQTNHLVKHYQPQQPCVTILFSHMVVVKGKTIKQRPLHGLSAKKTRRLTRNPNLKNAPTVFKQPI